MTEEAGATSPWWERQLPAVAHIARAYLSRHYPAIRHAHEDLVGDALLSLAERLKRDPVGLPQSWMESTDEIKEVDREHFFRLASMMVKRRAVDYFRDNAREWSSTVNIEEIELEQIPGETLKDQERRHLAAQMLAICVNALADMSEEDRNLIAILSGEAPLSGRPLTAGERQRLHRLRRKLADEIRRQLGDTVKALLVDLG
jgi:DNA-directed RNA polymerase specialized sigma24 family protein